MVKISAENLGEFAHPDFSEFDVVVAGDIIEHLGSPGLFLRSARDLLKPDGKLILTTPNIYAFWSWFLYGVLGWAEPWPEHTCYFTPCSLRQMLDRYGWRIEEMRTVSYDNTKRRFRILKAVPERLERMKPCICVAARKGPVGGSGA